MDEKKSPKNCFLDRKMVEKWLTGYFQQPIKLKSCKPTKIGAGQGFTSTILRLALEYEIDNPVFPKSVILKTPSKSAVADTCKKFTMGNGDMKPEIESHILGHGTECTAYTLLGKYSPIPLPIIYAATKCEKSKMGIILMEDLGDKATTVGDPTHTLSLEQLYEVAEVMAEWHAWCMTTDIDWKRYFEAADSERRKQEYDDEWLETVLKCFQVSSENSPLYHYKNATIFSCREQKKITHIFSTK